MTVDPDSPLDPNSMRVYHMCGIFGSGFNLANHVNITKLNVCHLGCTYGFLSIQYIKLSIRNLTNCSFRANCQIFNSPIIPCMYMVRTLLPNCFGTAA